MVDPLLFFSARTWKRRGDVLRRTVVGIPNDAPSTDALFLVLRRMRTPIIALMFIFTVSVLGLTLIEGRNDAGEPYKLTVFEAFYFMSITATTIGFGELPYAFTELQRMWVTGSVYASVIGWAYAVGSLFTLVQEPGFREAIMVERFRRKVARINEPFLIISGYGHAGRLVTQGLDAWRRSFVVIDGQRSRIELLIGDQLAMDPPALHGELTDPSLLGLAGLGSKHCAGVLALTDDDDVNLATVMAVHLLRPEVPVITRAADRVAEEHMHDFSPLAVINPYDRFGGYLLVALQRPNTYRFVTWLMGPRGGELPDLREGLGGGRWVVCAEGHFGAEIVNDLTRAGLEVVVADPADGDPDVSNAVGFIAGTELDTTNLSLAVHARLANPSVYLAVRQKAHTNSPLVEALDFDSVFMPTDLVAREALARVVTPALWSFLDEVLRQGDDWARRMTLRLVTAGGTRAPVLRRLELTANGAPAAYRWLSRGLPLTIGDLVRNLDDRDRRLPIVPLKVLREGENIFDPPLDTPLRANDAVLCAGRSWALDMTTRTLFYDTAIEYAATGRRLPETWVWRRIAIRRRDRAMRAVEEEARGDR